MSPANADAAAPQRDLKERLIARIRADGPLSIAAYMAEALYDPRAGYYATKDPIGAGGDFVTAPEVSQMFGELIGLWCVQSWLEMGEPSPIHLIELGPGRGVMMADMLRAARLRPDFLAACEVSLIEASPALAAAQAARLSGALAPVSFAPSLDAAPAGPAIIVGNEFLDCLPIRQFIHAGGAWRERLVALDPGDEERLAFYASPAPLSATEAELIPEPLRSAPEGALVEVRPGVAAMIDALAQRTPGPLRALFIDYGPAESEIGDTLQAVRAHQKVDPLDSPGEADLTARVDFVALAQAATAAGLETAGSMEQGAWLNALGLEQRAAALMSADRTAKKALASEVHRLTDPDEMGALFKVIGLSSPGLPSPAGFPRHAGATPPPQSR